MGGLRDAGHTHRYPRPADGRTRDILSGDGVDPHLWDEGCCPRGCLYDNEAGPRLADWVASKGKHLTTIYITHGHGDHWFGVGTLLERFPDARVVVTPKGDAPKCLAGGARRRLEARIS